MMASGTRSVSSHNLSFFFNISMIIFVLMSITVIESPLAVMPIGNEIPLKLQTDNRYVSAGSAAILTFTFSGIDEIVGRTFVLEYGDVSLQFFLAVTPDDSGSQIRKATSGLPIDYWMAWFAEDMMRNYYLNRDFDCVVDTGADTIALTAKEVGTDYSVTIDFNNVANLVITEVAGVDPVARENYELVCMTEILDGSIWRRLAEDRLAPDSNNQVILYFQDLLAPEIEAEHTWPEVPATYHALRSNHIKQYTIYYAERYDNVVRRLTSYSNVVYAILGAFDYKMVAALNGQDYSYLDFIITYKSFLTWQPASKTINLTQPEKLFFLVFNDISSAVVHIRVYYTDGTDSGDQELETISSVDQYTVYELMVGYSQIDFSKWIEKAILKYEIWLEDNAGNVQSQTREFILETKTFRHERIFLFRNSFGAMDTFRATGRKTQRNEYERMVIESNHEGFSIQDQYLALERSVFTVNTGWLTFAQRNWLRELLLSREVYEIIGDYKFPIIIQDEKRDFMDDDNYLYSLEINYKYAFKDPAFSGDYISTPLLAENLEILLNENGEPLFA